MNVYDFDKTIHAGDSTVGFWKFCVRRHPAVLRALPRALCTAVLYKLGRVELDVFKGDFYRFLRHLPDVEDEVAAFWEFSQKNVYEWYLRQKRADDLIITASPEFLVGVMCAKLGVRCIGSLVDCHTGALLGPNCKGEQKVQRMYEQLPAAQVEQFYSDSFSDQPLADVAQSAFLVMHGRPTPWPERE